MKMNFHSLTYFGNEQVKGGIINIFLTSFCANIMKMLGLSIDKKNNPIHEDRVQAPSLIQSRQDRKAFLLAFFKYPHEGLQITNLRPKKGWLLQVHPLSKINNNFEVLYSCQIFNNSYYLYLCWPKKRSGVNLMRFASILVIILVASKKTRKSRGCPRHLGQKYRFIYEGFFFNVFRKSFSG